jgi:serine/threonine-protein kinase
MPTVFLAADIKHDRNVAINVVHPGLAAVLGAERFAGEIRTAARLQHPHVLPLPDSDDTCGSLLARADADRQLPAMPAFRISVVRSPTTRAALAATASDGFGDLGHQPLSE